MCRALFTTWCHGTWVSGSFHNVQGFFIMWCDGYRILFIMCTVLYTLNQMMWCHGCHGCRALFIKNAWGSFHDECVGLFFIMRKAPFSRHRALFIMCRALFIRCRALVIITMYKYIRLYSSGVGLFHIV